MTTVDIISMIITLMFWALICGVALALIPIDDDNDSDDKGDT